MAHDLRKQVAAAVAHFWTTRKQQESRQGEKSGRRDAGSRTAVTGGKQLDGFVAWVQRILQDAGMRKEDVHIDRRRTVLPGYFRATKEWDLVVTVDGKLLATVEFKS